jgi:hypothetical protein
MRPASHQSSPNTPRTLYHTPLTHSISLTELVHLPRALICVSPGPVGIIEWIEEDVEPSMLEQVASGHGVILADGDVEVVEIREGGGIVPGLVDTHTVSSV